MKDYLSGLLREKGTDLYRIKGVISVEGAPQRFVYQAVHMIFQGDFKEAWAEVRHLLRYFNKRTNEQTNEQKQRELEL